MTEDSRLPGEQVPQDDNVKRFGALISSRSCRYGQTMFLKTDNPIGFSMQKYGEWSAIEAEFHCKMIGDDSVVIDVGANIGSHTLAYCRKAKTGRVIFFEPQPLMFYLVSETIRINGIINATGHCAAVADRLGTADFEFPDYEQMGNFGMVKRSDLGSQLTSSSQVPLTTIDNLELSRCDFIKIDAEGGTRSILEGAINTIASYQPTIATEVLGVEDGWNIMKFIAEKDLRYTCYIYRFSAYNKRNFNRNYVNYFGAAEECGLLFCKGDLDGGYVEDGLCFIKINTLDQLAEEFGRTSKYGDYTPFDRKPETIGHLYIDLLRHLVPASGNSTRADSVEMPPSESLDHVAQLSWDRSRADCVSHEPSRADHFASNDGGGSHSGIMSDAHDVFVTIAQRQRSLDEREEALLMRELLLNKNISEHEDRRLELSKQEQQLDLKAADCESKVEALNSRARSLQERETALDSAIVDNLKERESIGKQQAELSHGREQLRAEQTDLESQKASLSLLSLEVRTAIRNDWR
ncbi:FkbM family methyltransferase [Rhizobium sp. LjRoot98]|uniref:FkbM family methyltransferase n=1 Tax=Rhizobium sp. LjRoot98 TaxID=3342345 RepID=UPI003ECCEAC8